MERYTQRAGLNQTLLVAQQGLSGTMSTNASAIPVRFVAPVTPSSAPPDSGASASTSRAVDSVQQSSE